MSLSQEEPAHAMPRGYGWMVNIEARGGIEARTEAWELGLLCVCAASNLPWGLQQAPGLSGLSLLRRKEAVWYNG